MTPAEALAALRTAHADGAAYPVPTLRAWARLAGVDAMARVDLTTGDAMVVELAAGQLDIAPPLGSDAGVSGAKSV